MGIPPAWLLSWDVGLFQPSDSEWNISSSWVSRMLAFRLELTPLALLVPDSERNLSSPQCPACWLQFLGLLYNWASQFFKINQLISLSLPPPPLVLFFWKTQTNTKTKPWTSKHKLAAFWGMPSCQRRDIWISRTIVWFGPKVPSVPKAQTGSLAGRGPAWWHEQSQVTETFAFFFSFFFFF